MKKFLLIFLWVGLLGGSATAQDISLFEQGNQAYADGDYETAIEHYEDILENGETSVALHYNLGNAYYRLNDVASSIYHYEKALQLEPGDEDVLNNLQFAQNMTIDEIEARTPSDFEQWRDDVLDLFGTSGWAWAAIVGVLLSSLLFLLYFFGRNSLWKRIFFAGSLVFLFLGIGAAALGYVKESVLEDQAYSIVFAEEIEIRSEPSTSGSEVFVLHAGTKVEVLEEHQGWSKISIPSGAQGWVEQENLKKL